MLIKVISYNTLVIKTLKVKLILDNFQHRALLSTMNMFNQIQNEISEIAFKEKEYQKYKIQTLIYHNLKEKYLNYSSQLIIRAIDSVSCSYKTTGTRVKRPNGFKKTGAVVYDERVISFKDNIVSIWTTEGRLKIPIKVYNKELFSFRKGQTDLIYQEGNFYLMCSLEVPILDKFVPQNVIGVDLGIKQIATTSDGGSYSGEVIEKKRKQYSSHRRRLQLRNTRSSLRKIKKVGKKESRFRKDVNHQISKKLVEKAKGTLSALVLEELKHINSRTTVRKSQRNERLSWSFNQLRSFIEYKAEEAGVTVVTVDPAYTSQTCSKCGHCEKKNRKNQSSFVCQLCGFATNADYNASINIKNVGLQSISLLLDQPKVDLVASQGVLTLGS